MAASSGTVVFQPSNADLTLTAFRRIGIRSSEITNEHMVSARMAMNLVQATWSIKSGVNLWKTTLVTVPLVQGIATYGVAASTTMMLDAYIRIFPMGSPDNFSPSFTTTSSSASVQITWTANGLSVGNWINVVIPVSVGGIIIYGFYQVVSVLDSNNLTITTASAASSPVIVGGAVPILTTTSNSIVVTATLDNHSYLSGQSFVVQVSTTLGGITIYGSYTITSIIDANNFTFNAASPATSGETLAENTGLAQLVGQNTAADPFDRVLNPISRTDYASLPNKLEQGFPTTYWFDRLINPTVTLWDVPDGNGPYELLYYAVSQIQDESPTMGQVPDIPYRALECLVADLSYFLSKEWNPQMEAVRMADAEKAWALFGSDDRERVPTYITPDFSSYMT